MGKVIEVVRILVKDKMSNAMNISMRIDFFRWNEPTVGSFFINGTFLNLFRAPNKSNKETKDILIKNALP